MKPNPFASLNHFTLPFVLTCCYTSTVLNFPMPARDKLGGGSPNVRRPTVNKDTTFALDCNPFLSTIWSMHDEHFEKLLKLIDIERDAERAENERKLEKLPVQAREALGKTVTRLVISREDYGVGGHVLWVLSRPSHG